MIIIIMMMIIINININIITDNDIIIVKTVWRCGENVAKRVREKR